ncbi:bifunctional YncE family protein/alkaline phosphatase family protein [Fibrella aquatica]|uniref:bifunctional YncE family protein/alkaline phosphatase family protein n=1 Tax=Fibrella aquatica TaxID=3242487 RepID=UPI0035202357
MRTKVRVTCLLLLSIGAIAQPKPPTYLISAPAGSAYTQIDKAGKTVLPNGRFITPRGKQIETAPHPYGLVLSPDGNTVITANSGINPFSISIIRNALTTTPTVRQVPEGVKTDNGVLEACFMGLAVSPDNKLVYVAGGETNKIFLFDIATGKPAGSINCEAKQYSHGYIGDMALTRDGKTLYAVDQIGFRLLIIDVPSRTIRHNVPTGRYPFGVTLSPDEKTAYVANVGVFEYKPFTDLDKKDLKRTAHDYPSSKYGSKEMREGDEKYGVPALGDPNVPEAFSVWQIKLDGSPANPAGSGQAVPGVTAKIKTGFLVGQMVEDFPAVGGSSPNSVVATDQYVFVSNGNNDCVSVIDVNTSKVIKNIALSPDARLGNRRGVIPFGLALSPNNKRLFVAEAGINAVAVIDVASLAVVGHIPAGWFPSKLKVSQDGKQLIVANAKGFGSGPNGGKTFTLSDKGSYIGNLMNGTVSVMSIPTDTELKAETEQVVQNNFTFTPISNPADAGQAVPATNPIPAYPGQPRVANAPNPIKHIVFIAKENRTYDEVLGQLPGGRGDSTLARYGVRVSVANKRTNQTVDKAAVMPNHHALARRFAMSDNFYCDSDVSADGHRWLVNTYPNEWVETNTAASYGGRQHQRDSSDAPGNRAFVGSAGSIYPEDYNEGGSMWDHLERWKKEFFNFGFGVEMAGAYSDSTMKYIGEKYTINYPLPAPLFDRTSRIFPTYNMAIPDQFRADLFMKEFNEKWGKDPTPTLPVRKGAASTPSLTGRVGVGSLPDLLTLMLPNDHGTRPRPKAGFPFTESYMADNDLALGRVVEFLSKTPEWKNMLIVVLEDDPQGGVDHVDAHRSPLLVISPWVKRDYVGHVHYSFGSVFKTFWNILGMPCLNQYDAGATDLSDLFTDKPDFTPYRAVPADIRLFDPQKALDPFDEKFDWKAFSESEELDRTETMQKRRAEDDDEARKKKPVKKAKTKRPR